jgi:hypothetical protein
MRGYRATLKSIHYTKNARYSSIDMGGKIFSLHCGLRMNFWALAAKR